MAIFKKKTEDAVEQKAVAPVKTESAAVGIHDVSWVLKAPRITEKAAIAAEKGVYVFNVDQRATKANIARAIQEAYKVSPIKINIAKEPRKFVTRRKRSGTTSGYRTGNKKAYIFLKKGDTIQFV